MNPTNQPNQPSQFFDFSWKQGNIVRLKEPYKPGVPAKALVLAITAQSDPNTNAPYRNWQGFTHGIIVAVLKQQAGRGVTRVSLHLYDPQTCVLYVVPGGNDIPSYVDFGVDELIPWHRADDENYEHISNSN